MAARRSSLLIGLRECAPVPCRERVRVRVRVRLYVRARSTARLVRSSLISLCALFALFPPPRNFGAKEKTLIVSRRRQKAEGRGQPAYGSLPLASKQSARQLSAAGRRAGRASERPARPCPRAQANCFNVTSKPPACLNRAGRRATAGRENNELACLVRLAGGGLLWLLVSLFNDYS